MVRALLHLGQVVRMNESSLEDEAVESVSVHHFLQQVTNQTRVSDQIRQRAHGAAEKQQDKLLNQVGMTRLELSPTAGQDIGMAAFSNPRASSTLIPIAGVVLGLSCAAVARWFNKGRCGLCCSIRDGNES
jgi:hypothetical protein